MSMTLIGIDLDGTLEDSRRDMVAAVHRVRGQFNLPPKPESAVLPFINQGMDALYQTCFDDFIRGNPDNLKIVRLAYEQDYSDHVADETKLYPGIREALAQLADLGSLVVITNKPAAISLKLLGALGVKSWVSGVIGGDTCREIKPSPRMLEAAAAYVNHDRTRGRAFMIGDTGADIKMGKAYGAATIWCAWGYLKAPPGKPDFIARRPAELENIVRLALAERRQSL